MSADNSIIVGKFNNQWRVIHCGADDNLTYNCHLYDNNYNYDEVYRYFKNAKRFYSEEAAFDYAYELEEYYGYVEYGVYLTDFDCTWDETLEKRLYEGDEEDDEDDFDAYR